MERIVMELELNVTNETTYSPVENNIGHYSCSTGTSSGYHMYNLLDAEK